MEKIINGFSVDENLTTGTNFYGELGTLVGVIEFDGNNVAIIKNQEEQYTYRDTVIDTSVEMTKKGPVVSERIFVGMTEKQLDDRSIELISEGNLNLIGNGEVNVDLGLQQSQNSVFVAEDGLLGYLRTCKNMHPELPLTYAIKMIPYENEVSKSM